MSTDNPTKRSAKATRPEQTLPAKPKPTPSRPMDEIILRERVSYNLHQFQRAVMALNGMQAKEFNARIGIKDSTIGMVFNKNNWPKWPQMVRCCDEFGMTMDYLFRGIKSGMDQRVARKIAELSR